MTHIYIAISIFLTVWLSVARLTEGEDIDIWLGKAPKCKAHKYGCTPFNMELVRLAKKNCWLGKKALCRMKVEPTSSNRDPDTLNLLQYNVFTRPFIATHDGQVERICRLPEAIAKAANETDVIVINEGFITTCLSYLKLRNLFSHYGWAYSTATIKSLGRLNGGVFIVSRWPIEYKASYIFKATAWSTADALSAKGVIYAKINKLGKSYDIFGTHLQAEDGTKMDNVRIAQLAEMKKFIEKNIGIDHNARVVFAGDFNMDPTRHASALQMGLGALNGVLAERKLDPLITTGHLKSMNFTYDHMTNTLVEHPDYPRSWFDYVGYAAGYKKPKVSRMDALQIVAEKEFNYCSSAKLQPFWVASSSSLCKKQRSTNDLSDHWPVMGRFKF